MGVAGVRRKDEPIVVRLSGHAQTNDRLAIREMGRQISEAEGRAVVESSEGDNVELDDEVRAPGSRKYTKLMMGLGIRPDYIALAPTSASYATEPSSYHYRH